MYSRCQRTLACRRLHAPRQVFFFDPGATGETDMANIIWWIVLGLVAGFIARYIMPGTIRGGVVATIILGVLGAVVGGFLGKLIGLGDVATFDLRSLALAVGGAGLLRRRRK